jgi:hypothetical protein
LLLGAFKNARRGDSLYIEDKIKDDDQPPYQVLSPMNGHKLKKYINNYLVEEHVRLDCSYFFFYALPADIKSNKIVDNTRYQSLKAYDDDNGSEVDFNIDSRGFIRKPS